MKISEPRYTVCFDKTQLLKLLAINSLIALILTLVTQSDFWINLIYSQSIGISIATLVYFMALRKLEGEPNVFRLGLAIILGVGIGITIATIMTGNEGMIAEESGQEVIISSFFYSTIIGSIVVFYFSLIAKQQKISNQLNIEKIKQVETERALAENNLKLLQAQIEPHFLFNTLSNVLGLIDSRPDDAKKMLENFTNYLRASLSRTRECDTTLKDEIDIVNSYLSIQKIRMGNRLSFDIKIDDDLYDFPFPPLMIQPLVENSVRHGLEPEIEGGHIDVRVINNDKIVSIVVSDTGKGEIKFEKEGVGLNNIRERLASLFQHNAELKIEKNKPKGLIVTIQAPRRKT